jgi:transcriptional regulator with XRE-family HTH domain
MSTHPTSLSDIASHPLRQLREKRGWSLNEAAWICGVSPSFIAAIEQGKRRPSAETAIRIARGFKVPVSRLFDSSSSSDEKKQ